MLREKCIGLLALWCEKLLSLQYRNTGKKELDGGIFCPQCGIIHGRKQKNLPGSGLDGKNKNPGRRINCIKR